MSNRVVLGLVLTAYLGVISAFIGYEQYRNRVPEYEAGTCLKIQTRAGNEFESAQFEYFYIIEVGSNNYKLARITFVDDKDYIYVYNTVMAFDIMYRVYSDDANVISCEDLKDLLKNKRVL